MCRVICSVGEMRGIQDMRETACDGCLKQFPVGETFNVLGKTLCRTCTEGAVSNIRNMPGDPAANRPFPLWVRVCALAVVALMIFSVAWNLRFLCAYAEVTRGLAAANNHDIESAVTLLKSASANVPESREVRALAGFYEGIQLLSRERPGEAVGLLERGRGFIPPETLEALIMQARIGVAFDQKDYDEFMKLAATWSIAAPNDPIRIAQLASAYACKYAVSGDEKMKAESLKYLEDAKTLSTGGPEVDEYEQRILHRLATREVIDHKEFKRRFPGGWRQEGRGEQ